QALKIQKDAFRALLVEVGMLTKAHQIRQQASRVQRSPAVVDHQRAPIRLPSHRTVGPEQMTVNTVLYLAPGIAPQQISLGRIVVLDGYLKIIDAATRQGRHAVR